MRVQARHEPNFVPGSELECVALASQIGGAAALAGSLLQASSQRCQQLDGQVGAAAWMSALLLQVSSQSCQQVGAQVPMLPRIPQACKHKPRSNDQQILDMRQLGTALAEASQQTI